MFNAKRHYDKALPSSMKNINRDTVDWLCEPRLSSRLRGRG